MAVCDSGSEDSGDATPHHGTKAPQSRAHLHGTTSLAARRGARARDFLIDDDNSEHSSGSEAAPAGPVDGPGGPAGLETGSVGGGSQHSGSEAQDAASSALEDGTDGDDLAADLRWGPALLWEICHGRGHGTADLSSKLILARPFELIYQNTYAVVAS